MPRYLRTDEIVVARTFNLPLRALECASRMISVTRGRPGRGN